MEIFEIRKEQEAESHTQTYTHISISYTHSFRSEFCLRKYSREIKKKEVIKKIIEDNYDKDK